MSASSSPLSTPTDFADFVRDARAWQDCTQAELALACCTQQSSISDLETGEVASATLDFAIRVAAALGFRLALVPFTAADNAKASEVGAP